MAKFKIGDIVIGNEKSNHVYGITTEGSKLKVVEVSQYYFSAKLLYTPLYTSKCLIGREYKLSYDYFDLSTEGDKIVITTDGVTTTAKMYCGKEVIKKAEAKCAPGDKFDFEFGARLAMDRLVEDTKKKEKIKKELIDICGTKIGFNVTESFSFTGTSLFEPMKVKKSSGRDKLGKMITIDKFSWKDFTSGEIDIICYNSTEFERVKESLKRMNISDETGCFLHYALKMAIYVDNGVAKSMIGTRISHDHIYARDLFTNDTILTGKDWDKFLEGKGSIKYNERTIDNILRHCAALGIRWKHGQPANEWQPTFSHEGYITYHPDENRIGYVELTEFGDLTKTLGFTPEIIFSDEKEKEDNDNKLTIKTFSWPDFHVGKSYIYCEPKDFKEIVNRITRRFPCIEKTKTFYVYDPSTYSEPVCIYVDDKGELNWSTSTFRKTGKYIPSSEFFKDTGFEIKPSDWEEWMESRATIRYTEDNFDSLMLSLKQLGYHWIGGEDPDGYKPAFKKGYITKNKGDSLFGFVSDDQLSDLFSVSNVERVIK